MINQIYVHAMLADGTVNLITTSMTLFPMRKNKNIRIFGDKSAKR